MTELNNQQIAQSLAILEAKLTTFIGSTHNVVGDLVEQVDALEATVATAEKKIAFLQDQLAATSGRTVTHALIEAAMAERADRS